MRPLAWRRAVAGRRLLRRAHGRRQSRRCRPGRGRPALRLPRVRLLVRSLLDHLLPARALRQRAAELQRCAPLGASALPLATCMARDSITTCCPGKCTPFVRSFIKHVTLTAMSQKSQHVTLTVLNIKQCTGHWGLWQG